MYRANERKWKRKIERLSGEKLLRVEEYVLRKRTLNCDSRNEATGVAPVSLSNGEAAFDEEHFNTLEKRLEELQQKKKDLFAKLKRVLHEEELRKQEAERKRREEEAAAILQMDNRGGYMTFNPGIRPSYPSNPSPRITHAANRGGLWR